MTRSTSARSDARVAGRVVHHGDGVAWLRAAALPPDHAIVTSLPDLSELPAGGVPAWRAWFEEAAELACRAVADDGLAIFFQTDAKHDGRWIDKAYLVQRGAERAGAHLLWHKVVCRVPPGRITFGRPAYAHLLCLSRARRLPPGRATADVLPGLGAMPWARAMGVDVCRAVVRFLRAEGAATVVDPFCGVGTILAAANEAGLAAIGVELSRKRAARARALALDPAG